MAIMTYATDTDAPMIYVACLASYNNGKLHGAWIDAAQGVEGIEEDVEKMLKSGPYGSSAEEWAIHDYQGFGGYRLSEWESFGTVAKLAEAIEEHGPAFTAFLDAFGLGAEEALEAFDDAYLGEKNIEDYAWEYVDSTGLVDMDSFAGRYFDLRAFARDLRLGGDVVEHDGHLFRGNW